MLPRVGESTSSQLRSGQVARFWSWPVHERESCSGQLDLITASKDVLTTLRDPAQFRP